MDAPTGFLWVGNHPATDLCNTEPVVDGRPVDLLEDDGAVLAWARAAGVAAPGTSTLSPAERARTAEFARRLRAALRPVLESGRRDDGALAPVNRLLATETAVLAVAPERPDPVVLTARTDGGQHRLDLAAAVVDIFRHDPRRIRRCAGAGCVLLFLDTSRNGRRRWCDMAACGNRAKVAAHYARTRR